MPATSGIRSYQVVNEGTDDQFVRINQMNFFSIDFIVIILDFVWIFSINTTNSDYMDLYCVNCGISSTSLLLETTLVFKMLLQTC